MIKNIGTAHQWCTPRPREVYAFSLIRSSHHGDPYWSEKWETYTIIKSDGFILINN